MKTAYCRIQGVIYVFNEFKKAFTVQPEVPWIDQQFHMLGVFFAYNEEFKNHKEMRLGV